MSDGVPFTDPSDALAMEAEHLPLWKAFIRAFDHLLVPGVRLMDFGCNRGGLLFSIFEQHPQEPASGRPALGVGLDVDVPVMREILAGAAAANGGRHPLLFTTAGPESFPGQFDLVISHEVVYLLRNLRGTFAAIHASVAPGGHFCFATGCHLENPLLPIWRSSFRDAGIEAHEHSVKHYEGALRDVGFGSVRSGRLLLTPAEYRAWVEARGSAEPNPAWFPSAASEENYYTRIGKMLLTAEKD